MGIKDHVKKSFWGRYAISELHCIESWLLPRLFDEKKAVKKFYKKRSGRELNLENPVSFSEKMSWYKIKIHDPLMVKCSDKLAVREYITQKGYGECLSKILGTYDSASDIMPEKLPEKFVLKATHGSHMNLIINGNKDNINWKREKLMMQSWLHQDIYWAGREWAYKDVPRKIIAEEYMEDDTGELKDYKFFCFNGAARFMIFIANRYIGEEFINFYDQDMNLMPVRYKKLPNNASAVLPISKDIFDRMKSIAEDLAQPFQEVRVDFYVVRNKIYVGELTFYSGGGFNKYIPEKYDEIFGGYWSLDYDQGTVSDD